jgi:hypothetical protein
MQNKIITFSVLLIALTLAYYLLIYIPEQKQISAQQQCSTRYNSFLADKEKLINKGLQTCEFTGVCTRDQFLARASSDDPASANSKSSFLSSCLQGFGY